MADRTSAALFAGLFEKLASGNPIDARLLWKQARGYDFAPVQMECGEHLLKLGLAWVCTSGEKQPCGFLNYGPEPSKCEECGATGGPAAIKEAAPLDRPRGASAFLLWCDHKGRAVTSAGLDGLDMFETGGYIRSLEAALEVKGAKINRPSIGMEDVP